MQVKIQHNPTPSGFYHVTSSNILNFIVVAFNQNQPVLSHIKPTLRSNFVFLV